MLASAKKKVIKEWLIALHKSCQEGYDGTWDCTTDEGRKGFEPMQMGVERIAQELGIKLKLPHIRLK